MDEVGLGKSLQQARQAAGLTQQQLCQKAGLSYSTLAKIERGAIKSPSIFTIQSIAGAVGLTLSELMGDIVPKVVEIPKKTSKNGVRFVYFDINGCLVRFFHRAFTRLAEDSGAPADLVETTFWHYNDVVCKGEMSMEEFNRTFGERIGKPDLNWIDYYLDAIDPIEEMQELLEWASEHYYVGLLSNIMPGFIEAMMDRGMLPKVPYTSVIDSSVTGAIKPEQQIYEAAQAYTNGCQSQEILLVDDARPNLMAAEKMGWKVLWFDDYRPEESVARIRNALEFDEAVVATA